MTEQEIERHLRALTFLVQVLYGRADFAERCDAWQRDRLVALASALAERGLLTREEWNRRTLDAAKAVDAMTTGLERPPTPLGVVKAVADRLLQGDDLTEEAWTELQEQIQRWREDLAEGQERTWEEPEGREVP